MIIILLIVAVIVWILVLRIFKIPRCGNMLLITGGIKTGKSTLSVRMVYKLIRRQRRQVWLYNHIAFYVIRFVRRTLFKKKGYPEPTKKDRPLVYSNIPLAMDYVPLTDRLLRREDRFVYGSVVYICETSLVADSMSFKDGLLNEQLLLFCKLFAHETKGGYLVLDTQSISDNHYAIKRCLSSYFYIHHAVKIPFLVLMFVRELKFSEDNTAVNNFNEDVEDSLKITVVPKKTWKLFDCYCYSVLTDHLPAPCATSRGRRFDLKAHKIISFKKYRTIKTVGGEQHEDHT